MSICFTTAVSWLTFNRILNHFHISCQWETGISKAKPVAIQRENLSCDDKKPCVQVHTSSPGLGALWQITQCRLAFSGSFSIFPSLASTCSCADWPPVEQLFGALNKPWNFLACPACIIQKFKTMDHGAVDYLSFYRPWTFVGCKVQVVNSTYITAELEGYICF